MLKQFKYYITIYFHMDIVVPNSLKQKFCFKFVRLAQNGMNQFANENSYNFKAWLTMSP